jgi:hypothetical protein
MARQLGDQLKRDRHRARIAVAGADTINRALFAQQTVQKVRPLRNGGAELRSFGQCYASRPFRDVDNVLDFQPSIVESNRTD